MQLSSPVMRDLRDMSFSYQMRAKEHEEAQGELVGSVIRGGALDAEAM